MPETTQSHCNTCAGDRKHDVLRREVNTWVNDDAGIQGKDEYEMLLCCGCGTFSLRQTSYNSEWDEENISYYPPPIFRPLPRWLLQLDSFSPREIFIKELLTEIYVALQNDLLRLATMGIRALLEHVMIDKVDDNGTFKNNLDALEKQEFVSKSQRTILESVLEAGHATIHRAYSPSRDDLMSLIDITENIVESIYLNQHRAARIAGKVPPKRLKKPEPKE